MIGIETQKQKWTNSSSYVQKHHKINELDLFTGQSKANIGQYYALKNIVKIL